MSDLCRCVTSSNKPCQRQPSKKTGDNPIYCWQHQNCQMPKLPEAKIIPILAPAPAPAPAPAQLHVNHDIKITISDSGRGLWVCGDTKSDKEFIQSLNGRWNIYRKCWVLPLTVKDQLLAHFQLNNSDLEQQKKEKQKPIEVVEVVEVVEEKAVAEKNPQPQEPAQVRIKVNIYWTAGKKGVWVCGQTFAHKTKLLSLGGKWNPSKKCWVFPASKQESLSEYFQLPPQQLPQEQEQTESKEIKLLVTRTGMGLWVCGDTKKHKAFLSTLDGRWNVSRQCWVFPIKEKEALLEHFKLTEADLTQQVGEVTDPVPEGLAPVTVFFDGASKGNPGPAGYGVQIVSPLLEKPVLLSKYLGIATNNQAEYSGVLSGLQWIQQNLTKQPLNIMIKGDSQLAIKQLKGEYAVKSDNIKGIYLATMALLDTLRHDGHIINLAHVFREENKVADQLASNASFHK